MKVKIGSGYFPKRFVRRGADGSYSALNPDITVDGLRLQKALLGDYLPKAAFVGIGAAVAAVLLLILTLTA